MTTDKIVIGLICFMGVLIGAWAISCLVAGYISAGGIVPLIHHMMTASGLIKPLYTMVGFYSHIKGIEYLICVGFFIVFPLFYKYMEQTDEKVLTTIKK